MIALALDPAMACAVAGRGPLAVARWRRLIGAGAGPLLFADDAADDAGGAPASAALVRPYLPAPGDIAALRLLWIAGIPDAEAEPLVDAARAARVLVNVEDRPHLCDFYNMAEVRRGDLLLSVSTGGASPGIAARVRARLEADFGPEWAERLARLKAKRGHWRRMGLAPGEVGRLTEAAIRAKGWLP